MAQTKTEACPYCGTIHADKCSLVKAFEYHPDGSIKRVEFYTPGDYSPTILANVTQPPQVPRGPKVYT